MINLVIGQDIAQRWPAYHCLQIEAEIVNTPTTDALWTELNTVAQRVAQSYAMDMVNKRPAIAATRSAYKACGKEPNRYRPSAEALMRRMVKGMELYRTLTVIDLINLLSVVTGYSIGAFDADKIDGNELTLGIGAENEPYEAIGRGPLNIAGMPVWRDATGGIGTPTSDNDRTKLTEQTRRLLVTVNIYGLEASVEDTLAMATDLLTRHASATNITHRLI